MTPATQLANAQKKHTRLPASQVAAASTDDAVDSTPHAAAAASTLVIDDDETSTTSIGPAGADSTGGSAAFKADAARVTNEADAAAAASVAAAVAAADAATDADDDTADDDANEGAEDWSPQDPPELDESSPPMLLADYSELEFY